MTDKPEEPAAVRPSVVALPCGCFFCGRELIQCDECAEPEEETD